LLVTFAGIFANHASAIMTSPPLPSQFRSAFRIGLAAGTLVLAVTLLSIFQEPARACGGLPQNYAPIIAFELARDAGDLQALFGTDEPCRATLIERMDAINWVDVLVFIPAYGVFMACFFAGMRARDAGLGTLGLRTSIAAVLGDYAENLCLMNLTPALDPGSVWFALLPWATGVKWLALGGAAAVAAVLYAKSAAGRAWNVVAALICAAAFLTTVAALAVPAMFGPTVSLGVGLSWLAFLVTAAKESFRPVAPGAYAGAEPPRAG
jgi:hypothetical protein